MADGDAEADAESRAESERRWLSAELERDGCSGLGDPFLFRQRPDLAEALARAVQELKCPRDGATLAVRPSPRIEGMWVEFFCATCGLVFTQ